MEQPQDFQNKITDQLKKAEQAAEAEKILIEAIHRVLAGKTKHHAFAFWSHLLREEPMVMQILWKELSSRLSEEQKNVFRMAIFRTPLKRPEKMPLVRLIELETVPAARKRLAASTRALVPATEMKPEEAQVVRLAQAYRQLIESNQLVTQGELSTFYEAFRKRHDFKNARSGMELASTYLRKLKSDQAFVTEPVLRDLALRTLETEWRLMSEDLGALHKIGSIEAFYGSSDRELVQSIRGQSYVLYVSIDRLEQEVKNKQSVSGFVNSRLTRTDPRFQVAVAWISVFLREERTGYLSLDASVDDLMDEQMALRSVISPDSARRGLKVTNHIPSTTDSESGSNVKRLTSSERTNLKGADPLKEEENDAEIGRFTSPIDGFVSTGYYVEYRERDRAWHAPKSGTKIPFQPPQPTKDRKSLILNLVGEALSPGKNTLPLPLDAMQPRVASRTSGEIQLDSYRGVHVLDVAKSKPPLLMVEFDLPAKPSSKEFLTEEYRSWVRKHFNQRASVWLRPLNMADEALVKAYTPSIPQAPEEHLQAIQQGLLDAGLYDMESGPLRDAWERVSFAERLALMRQRALMLRSQHTKEVPASVQFAGICTDFALLACDLLRRQGFPAGIAQGFRLEEGRIRSGAGHTTAFVLIPSGEGVRARLFDATPARMIEKHTELKRVRTERRGSSVQSRKENVDHMSQGKRPTLKRILWNPPEAEQPSSIRVCEAFAEAASLWFKPGVLHKQASISNTALSLALQQGWSEAEERLGELSGVRRSDTLQHSLKVITERFARERGLPRATAIHYFQKLAVEALQERLSKAELQEVERAFEALTKTLF